MLASAGGTEDQAAQQPSRRGLGICLIVGWECALNRCPAQCDLRGSHCPQTRAAFTGAPGRPAAEEVGPSVGGERRVGREDDLSAADPRVGPSMTGMCEATGGAGSRAPCCDVDR